MQRKINPDFTESTSMKQKANDKWNQDHLAWDPS